MVRGIKGASPIRRTAAIAIAAAAATGLSACGAGQTAQTAFKDTPVAGINVDAGDLALRDLQVEFVSPEGYPAGEAAPLSLWISNGSTETVSLIGATSEYAERIVLVDEELVEVVEEEEPIEDAEPEEGEQGTEDDQAADGTDQQDEGEGTEGENGADTESTEDEAAVEEDEVEAAAGTADFEIELPSFAYVRLDMHVGGYLLLDGLQAPLGPGVNVPVTFQFSNGQTVTVEIPYGQAAEAPEREYSDNPGVGH